MEQITVQELDEKQKELFEQNAVYKEADRKAKEEYKKLEKLKAEHIARLEVLGKTSYKNDYGNFYYTMTEGFSLSPNLPERKKFYEYLKERDLYDAMITVNSQTLNSFAKREAAVAEEEGELDFQLPGLIKRDPYAKASLRSN